MEIDSVWEKIKKGLRDGAALSVEKIDQYTKIGKLKLEELGVKRKMERNYQDIGERVYDLVSSDKSEGMGADIAVTKAIENIKELKKELDVIQEKIDEINEEGKSSKSDEEVTGI